MKPVSLKFLNTKSDRGVVTGPGSITRRMPAECHSHLNLVSLLSVLSEVLSLSTDDAKLGMPVIQLRGT